MAILFEHKVYLSQQINNDQTVSIKFEEQFIEDS